MMMMMMMIIIITIIIIINQYSIRCISSPYYERQKFILVRQVRLTFLYSKVCSVR